MNRTRALKLDVIKEKLDKEKDLITIVSCNTCVRLAKTGGRQKMQQMAEKLRDDGYRVKDGFLVTVPCWDHCLENVNIQPDINTVIVLGCSCAYANIKTHFPDRKIVSAVMDRGTVVMDPETGRKSFRGTKS